jgi:ribosomal protein S12 methylthiotransferase accessory factor
MITEAKHLREKLASLAAASLTRNLYVDSLWDAYLKSKASLVEHNSFLLLDFHRIFLYDNPLSATDGSIDSVIRFMMDDCHFRPFAVIVQYTKRPAFDFLPPLEALDILPSLWRCCRPGVLLTLDAINGEIRTYRPHVHPESMNLHIAEGASGCLNADTAIAGLKVGLTGASLRIHEAVPLDDLVAPDAGIIRAEKLSEGKLSFPNAIAEAAAGVSMDPFFCSGRGLRPSDAVFAARCEAIERYQVNLPVPTSSLIYGSYDSLKDSAIDPQTLFFSHVHTPPPDGRSVYHKLLPIYWTGVQDPMTKTRLLVPAQEIWFNTRKLKGENTCVHGTTNGCAVGGSIAEAALYAVLELVERDAFITTWYMRRPCAHILPETVHSEAFQMLLARTQALHSNYDIHFLDLTTDIRIPVVLALAVKRSGSGPHIALSTACKLRCADAMFTALKDICVRLGRHMDVYDEKQAWHFVEHPQDVKQPAHHAALYSIQQTFQRLSFLSSQSREPVTASAVDRLLAGQLQNCDLTLEAVLQQLHAVGLTAFFKDLTHPQFAARGLFCVKAVIPGIYPIWFGYYNVRVAITERLRRLFCDFLDVRLIHERQLNLEMHPFD